MPTHKLQPQSQPGSPVDAAGWQGILDVIPAGVYTCDAAGLITYFNPLAEAVWGQAPKLRDSANRYCDSFKMYSNNGTPMPHDECWMALALREGKQYNGRVVQIERPDGSRIFGMAHANPLRNDQGHVIGAVNLVVDITITTQKQFESDPGKTRSMVTKYHDATLAMIEVAVSALVGMTWATSAFS